MSVNIQIEQSGFPVNVGEIKFFFSTKLEDLTKFYDVQDAIELEIKQLRKQIDAIKLEDEPSKKQMDEFKAIMQKVNAMNYDALLGDGAYEKIYERYPDMIQLFDLFDPIAVEVAEAIEKDMDHREEKSLAKRAEIMKKKALKNKKKKK